MVAAQLDRIFASQGFAGSPKLRRLLSYLVGETLAGRGEELKEYSIALAVFDRDASFDPRVDTVVRVQARRLRTQLELYFKGAGAGDPLEVRIPRGAYAAEFTQRDDGIPAGKVQKIGKWWPAAVVAALGLAAAVWLAVRPGQPAIWAYEGNILRVMDGRGRLCWTRQFPDLNTLFEPENVSRVLIDDIDGDGRKETLASVNRLQAASNRSSLVCLEQDGSLRWEVPFGAGRTFEGRTFSDSFHGRAAGTVRSGGRLLVLVLAAHYLWYPSQVALLDPRTGACVGEYWHPGRVYDVLARDLNGDGAPEILFAAINNPGDGPGHAAVGALRLPLRPPPQPRLGGGELAYILLPTPDVCRALGRLPTPFGLGIDGLGRIEVKIPLSEAGVVVYNLDFALNVVEHRPSHDLAPLHERLRKQGLLDHELTSGELEQLGKAVRFPEAPDGNSPEVRKLMRETGRGQ